jgi:hypothetical protein
MAAHRWIWQWVWPEVPVLMAIPLFHTKAPPRSSEN